MIKKIKSQAVTKYFPKDITFILVKPRYPGNIGSVARGMKNMGFSRLVVVSPATLPTHPEALRLAVGAADLLKKAKVYETVEEACKGLHFLVGTSRRVGKHRSDFVLLPELAKRLPKKQKIGILFGPEEKGLSNRDLAHCHLVCSIPSSPDFPSLNLAQAVMIMAYQLRLHKKMPDVRSEIQTTYEDGTLKPQFAHASVEELEGMYEHLEKALSAIRFFANPNAFHLMRSIRQIFGRTGLTQREVKIFRGICRQILWAATSK